MEEITVLAEVATILEATANFEFYLHDRDLKNICGFSEKYTKNIRRKCDI